MTAAIDTNILLDILTADRFAADSIAAVRLAQASGRTVICPVVYTELAAYFMRPTASQSGALDRFLADVGIELDRFAARTLIQAGTAWGAYSRKRPRTLTCGECGHSWRPTCPECQQPAAVRQHLVADFLIGAHAEQQAESLITRDRGYYRQYFAGLTLIAPGGQP